MAGFKRQQGVLGGLLQALGTCPVVRFGQSLAIPAVGAVVPGVAPVDVIARV